MEYVRTTIYCPFCKTKVGTHDGRTKTNVLCPCSKCRKLVIFDVEKMEAYIDSMPERASSSGKRYFSGGVA